MPELDKPKCQHPGCSDIADLRRRDKVGDPQEYLCATHFLHANPDRLGNDYEMLRVQT